MSYQHQDWTPVIVTKRSTQHVPKEVVAKPKTPRYASTGLAQTDMNAKKLDEANGEVLKVERVSPALRQQIIKARTAMKLTQSQLAQRINEIPKVVQEYENGTAVPNSKILQKMSKVLGVVLKKNEK